MSKILVTSSGCYAVADGKTVSLKKGSEFEVENKQAQVFIKSGKATLVVNTKADQDLDTKAKPKAK